MNANTGDLADLADDFASTLGQTLNRVLPCRDGKLHQVTLDQAGNRYVLEPARRTKKGDERPWVDLYLRNESDGPRIGRLMFRYHLVLDHTRRFLKVELSSCSIQPESDTSARLRLEYDNRYLDSDHAPVAHWQVQAHHNAFANWLTRAEKRKASRFGRVDKVHLSVGGERFRPCIEDVLQMLKTDFGVATKRGAQEAISEGRSKWREYQLRSAVRDHPALAAETLADCGYTVTPTSPKEPRPDKHTHY